MKVRCPACGKGAHLPESDAGLSAVCAACGATHTLPNVAPARATPANECATVDTPTSAIRRSPPRAALWVGLGLAACLAVLLVSASVLFAARVVHRTVHA